MPTSVLMNLWSCNVWKRQSEKEASDDVLATTINFNTQVSDIHSEPITVEGELVETMSASFANLTADWPAIGPVIDESKYIGRSKQSAVTDHCKDIHNSINYDNPETLARKIESCEIDPECFYYASYQLDVAGFSTTGNPQRNPDNFQVYQEIKDASGSYIGHTNIEVTVNGIGYMKQALSAGTPVLIGIKMKGFNYRKNDDKTTGHYIVVVGMDSDDKGYYFICYDYLQPPGGDGDKFYLTDMLNLVSDGGDIIAQIRKTRG